jgi:hypothetical protein
MLILIKKSNNVGSVSCSFFLSLEAKFKVMTEKNLTRKWFKEKFLPG